MLRKIISDFDTYCSKNSEFAGFSASESLKDYINQ